MIEQPILIHVSVALQKQNRFLLVQEKKPHNYGRWNLPGGHLEHGETIQQGAIREVLEETNLHVKLSKLAGIYTSIHQPDYHAIRFIFTAKCDDIIPTPGDDILNIGWHSLAELEAMRDANLVGGKKLRVILHNVECGPLLPLSVLKVYF